MKEQHTPGPWKWLDAEDLDVPTAFELVPSEAEYVGQFDSIAYHGADWPMRPADARLIAAAPDLLRLAQLVAESGQHAIDVDLVEMAEDIIAKVTH